MRIVNYLGKSVVTVTDAPEPEPGPGEVVTDYAPVPPHPGCGCV